MDNSPVNPLEGLLQKMVQIMTADGRIFVGFLRGLDQAMNTILSHCQERIYSTDADVQIEPLGLFFVRGDTIVMIGQLDDQFEQSEKWKTQRAQPLKSINMQ